MKTSQEIVRHIAGHFLIQSNLLPIPSILQGDPFNRTDKNPDLSSPIVSSFLHTKLRVDIVYYKVKITIIIKVTRQRCWK
jgi:hypothetical protein